jgi:16S rRNA (cytosine967-C5)-methyltransferase
MPAGLLEPADALAAELLRAADATHSSPSELMAARFRRLSLRPRQQKRVRDLFFGALAASRLIDHAIEVATPGGVAPPLAPALRILVSRVLAHDLSPKAAAAALPFVDWQRVHGLRVEVGRIVDPVRRLALAGSLPDWLAERLASEHGAEADALVESLSGRPPVVLRANTLRAGREALRDRLAVDGITTEPTRYANFGLRVTSPAQLFRTAAYREGWFEMQDEASQLVAEIVAPPPGGVVVDACAGAGGKTLALAAMQQNRGTILAVDRDERRLRDLRQRARRAGAHNVQAQRVPDDGWPDHVAQVARRADRILVDAPCSGVGSLRRNPDMRWRIDAGRAEDLRRIQVDLLARAAACLAPGARVVYATCTVLRDENEGVVSAVRLLCPELEVVPVVEILGAARGRPIADPTGAFLRTLPHRHDTDGFFAAVLRRRRL